MASAVDPDEVDPVLPKQTAARKSISFTDDEVLNMKSWDSAKVASWLKRIGLSQFEVPFVENEITGDILPILGVEELREMGVRAIGPRMYLLKGLKKLKAAYFHQKRNQVKWEGKEHLYGFPSCTCLIDYITSCCLPDPPDKYVLTGSSLKITEKVYPNGKICRLCSRGSRLNTIDLTKVNDVDAASNKSGCILCCGLCCTGGRDNIYINVEGKSSGKASGDDKNQTVLTLKYRESPAVVQMIRDAIEEEQVNVNQSKF